MTPRCGATHELKQLVRDEIAPGRSLGHADRKEAP